MTWTATVKNLCKQLMFRGPVTQPASEIDAHFDQLVQAVPPCDIAEGLTAAFNSDKTPAFGQMLSTLFSNSTADQKADLINHLFKLIGAGNTRLTPGQAQQLSPRAVQRLAIYAQNLNRSVVESISSFYAQHPALIKTMGGAALRVAMTTVAEKQKHCF
jgi:hypothetical protein